jgi:hypothetical protein
MTLGRTIFNQDTSEMLLCGVSIRLTNVLTPGSAKIDFVQLPDGEEGEGRALQVIAGHREGPQEDGQGHSAQEASSLNPIKLFFICHE